METNTKKSNYYGWVCCTTIQMKDRKVLTINTRKNSTGKIASHASVATKNGTFLEHAIYQDYSAIVAISDKRATEKNVKALHDSINLESVLNQAVNFYN